MLTTATSRRLVTYCLHAFCSIKVMQLPNNKHAEEYFVELNHNMLETLTFMKPIDLLYDMNGISREYGYSKCRVRFIVRFPETFSNPLPKQNPSHVR
jgi:hypothetical protein